MVVRKNEIDPIALNNKLSEKAVIALCQIGRSQAVALAEFEKGYQTGRTKGSIDFDTEGLEGVVFAGTDYAPYVEFGTYKQEAQPFMTPAKDFAEKQVNKIAEIYRDET